MKQGGLISRSQQGRPPLLGEEDRLLASLIDLAVQFLPLVLILPFFRESTAVLLMSVALGWVLLVGVHDAVRGASLGLLLRGGRVARADGSRPAWWQRLLRVPLRRTWLWVLIVAKLIDESIPGVMQRFEGSFRDTMPVLILLDVISALMALTTARSLADFLVSTVTIRADEWLPRNDKAAFPVLPK